LENKLKFACTGLILLCPETGDFIYAIVPEIIYFDLFKLFCKIFFRKNIRKGKAGTAFPAFLLNDCLSKNQ